MTDPHKSQVLQSFTDGIVRKFDNALKDLNTIIVSIDEQSSDQNRLLANRLIQLSSSLSTISASVASIKGVVINSFGPSGGANQTEVRAAVDALVQAANQRAAATKAAANLEPALKQPAKANVVDAGQEISADMLSKETLERLNRPVDLVENIQKAGIEVVDNSTAFQGDLQVLETLNKYGLTAAINTIAITLGNPITDVLNDRLIRPMRARLQAYPDSNPYKLLVSSLFPETVLLNGVVFPEQYEEVYSRSRAGLTGRVVVDGVNTYTDLVFEVNRFLVRIKFKPSDDGIDIDDIISVAPTYVSSYRQDGKASWIPITKLPHQLQAAVAEDIETLFNDLAKR